MTFLEKCKQLARMDGVLLVSGMGPEGTYRSDGPPDPARATMINLIPDGEIWKLERPMPMPNQFLRELRECTTVSRRGERRIAVSHRIGHPVCKNLPRAIRRALEG